MLATGIFNLCDDWCIALHLTLLGISGLCFSLVFSAFFMRCASLSSPMILGVVLELINAVNLARALAIDADPMLFITRPR